jgi:hypothetical protein
VKLADDTIEKLELFAVLIPRAPMHRRLWGSADLSLPPHRFTAVYR